MARSAIGRCGEIGIAEATIAAFGEPDLLAELGQIGDQRFIVFVENLRALRHFENNVSAFATRTVFAHAMAAGARFEMLLIAIIDERVEAVDAFDTHVTAASAVAASSAPHAFALAEPGGGGLLAEAEMLYRQILEVTPQAADLRPVIREAPSPAAA